MVGSEQYRSYAERLASWGYTVVRYDKRETVTEPLDDTTSALMLNDLINW